jgi:hypothetical protein
VSNYIDVPAADIERFLQNLRFERSKQRDEVVYIKRSTVDPCLMVKVYTSLTDGSNSTRGSGRDSIKVCVVFDDGNGRAFGVGKFPPVFRVTSVQSVLERLELKIREAAVRAREWLAQQGKSAPATPPTPPPSQMEMEDIRLKNLAAEHERLQEQAAFLADMTRQVPASEPPPRPMNERDEFRAYANKLSVPF